MHSASPEGSKDQTRHSTESESNRMKNTKGELKTCKSCQRKNREASHPRTEFGSSGASHYCRRCRQERSDEILKLAALGYSNQQIAEMIYFDSQTVDRYIALIKRKTGIYNRILLAFYALGKGIVTQGEVKAAIAKERRARICSN